MKQILITQKQFRDCAAASMHEYIDRMKSCDGDQNQYDSLDETADILTISVVLALLDSKLFNEGGEDDESNISC